MKKTLYFFFILISFVSYAQNGPNPFAEKESDNAFNRTNATKDNETQANHDTAFDPGGGNPGSSVPIDNYIPLLVITAVGIIVYNTHQKKKMLAKNSSK
ncbi:hypothetical protein [Kaistella jeonii]|uniref:Signal peptidase n=1 Tax=Kaistella jeonii TaxID=266749 RepID=A0A0C1FB87_9FLAO|nr:hypothetical protein [Kaistella jeonii]KIA89133.1 hypothetical protein OA86_08720 [Kaistella jeonii]SFB93581.1 hypothetical protein SAMN05421876_10413 [Kaistella jeonii]VEI97050.1 Uncharacterised protein [Kaistella jeonii]